MRRYLENFFRHPILLGAPVIVALVAGLAFSIKAPRTFTTAANLWCDATVPNPSTLQKPVLAGQNTPSADQLPVIQEFLQTKSFNFAVARRTPLAGYLATHSQFLADEAADQLARQVKVAILGPQVISITVKSNSAAMAASLAKGVVAEFIQQRTRALQQRDQSLVDDYRTQLAAAATAVNSSEAGLGAYLALHPQTATETDPRAGQLSAAVAANRQQQATLESDYSQSQLDLTHADDPSALHVIDAPVTPALPDGRKKQLIIGGVGGLLGGMVITLLTLVLLVVQDRSVREEDDIDSLLSLHLVGSMELFPKGTLPASGRRRWAGRSAAATERSRRRRSKDAA